jgi:serine phosphatase RsbU (regulator of sigma subunit)
VATRVAGLGRDKATYTEHVIMTKDGREVDVASTYAYVEGPDGAVEQGMEILRDLTEHKRWLRERHIANTLQKALLPEMPQSDLGIDIGVHYESATLQAAVGGDFYDFVRLPDGLLGIVIGDVCGKGIDAAHHAAMTKFTLRAYLLEGAPPATVMERLNDAIHAQVSPGEFISMCFGVLDPANGTFTYANAGHPRPLLRHGSEGWRTLDASGIVLGVAPRQTYDQETVKLGVEDVLLFYTDGLVETRRGPTVFGEERLHQFLARCRLTDAQQFAERIYQRSATFSGGSLIDDVAVMVVRL